MLKKKNIYIYNQKKRKKIDQTIKNKYITTRQDRERVTIWNFYPLSFKSDIIFILQYFAVFCSSQTRCVSRQRLEEMAPATPSLNALLEGQQGQNSHLMDFIYATNDFSFHPITLSPPKNMIDVGST